MVRGRLNATTEQAATDLLIYAGYQVISLKQVSAFFNFDKFSSKFYRVKPNEIILLFRQMALLLESGINITTALELLKGQIANPLLRHVLDEAVNDLRSGCQLSAALAKHPSIFSRIHCQTLGLGEQTGGLEVMLRQIADYIEKETVSNKSVKSALTYPIITAVIAVIVVSVLVAFVFPAFAGLYDSLGAELPTLTKLTISTAQWLRANGIYILGLSLGITAAAFFYAKTPAGRYKLDSLILKLPLLGRIAHLNELTRCCRSISLLFRAGLPLTEIMPLVIQSSGNKLISTALMNVQQDMLKGEGLSAPMSKNPLFLPMMVQMVKVGEETGKLDTTLASVARSYETDADDRTKALISLIQPAMTVIIAGLIGFIALSLVSAMYSVYGQVI